MIARIEGTLVAVESQAAHVRTDHGLTYEVLVPAYTVARLTGQTNQPVTLHTLPFLESQSQGATFVPRLAGFLSNQDKAFYELFVTCKGIGHRRALRAMTLATPQIAAAIADRDLTTLQSLPEIGKRTAETLTVNLRDKMQPFTTAAPTADAGQTSPAAGDETPPAAGGSLSREAVDALVALGEQRAEAMRWVDQVLSSEAAPKTAEQVLAEVYRLKAQHA